MGPINVSANYFASLLESGMAWLAQFAMLIAVIMVIWGGIKYIIAGGDEDEQKKARNIVVSALVGVAIVLLAPSLVDIVKSLLGA
jgi:hypothetical protein